MNTVLQDDAMLFITVKSAEGVHVPKVLQVVEEAKRIRHKAGKCYAPSMLRFLDKGFQGYLRKKSYTNTSSTTLIPRKKVPAESSWTMKTRTSRNTYRLTA